MMDGVRTAHVRADWALLGGVSLLILGFAPFIGVNLYSETRAIAPIALPVEKPVRPAVTSPVELAAAQLSAESQCLAEAVYYEARGEGMAGQKAVAEVVLRRTHNRNYAGTVCGVTREGVQPGRKTGCQFTYACDGSLNRKREGEAWQQAKLLAEKIMSGVVQLGNQTGGAVSYHNLGVQPAWADTMQKTAQIGNHIFYRFMPKDQVAQNAPVEQAGTKLMAADQAQPF
jgi:spore germination cell wall hydrolase CwlJ-like protein